MKILVKGPGWISMGGRNPRKVEDKFLHREYFGADGASEVRKGKKRKHKAFAPIVFGEQ